MVPSIHWWSALLVFNGKQKEIDMPMDRIGVASAMLNFNPDCSARTLAEALQCSVGYAASLRTFFRNSNGSAEAMRQKNSEASRRCRATKQALHQDAA